MIKNITKIILIIMIIIFLINFIFSNNINISKLNSNCWINNDLYPEAKYIYENREIIKKELFNILKSNKWSKWQSYEDNAPIFTKMTTQDILNKLETTYGKINEKNDGSWRLYGLILNKIPLETSKLCPNTIKILSKYSNKILNAGFSLIEPRGETKTHQDYNNNFYRLHIPLLIPQNNIDFKNKNKSSIIKDYMSKDNLAIFEVDGEKRIWVDDEYFIFDDTCVHNAQNNTDENRIVLLVDLLK
jgi:aspartyl/asparaginyl beta-hydroxylase (cupin superfamily)